MVDGWVERIGEKVDARDDPDNLWSIVQVRAGRARKTYQVKRKYHLCNNQPHISIGVDVSISISVYK